MIDRELYLPRSWADDPPRCRAARVPEQVGFRTKPELARVMLEGALDAGVPAAWVTADEVYGGSPMLRQWLEGRGLWHVLAVKCTEPLAAPDPDGPGGAHTSAAQLAAAVPAAQWIACSAGHGAKGRRLYDWTRIKLASPATSETARWLLVRRSRSDGELAFYACSSPAATPLIGLVRVAGTRWAVEEGFEQAKGEVGLDHYEVRRWPGWYRHITLALLAHAFLAVTRAQATSPSGQRGTRRPERRARSAPADGSRGPPAAGGAGVDHPGQARLRAGLVQVAPTPSGPSKARTLPPSRTASAAGVLIASALIVSIVPQQPGEEAVSELGSCALLIRCEVEKVGEQPCGVRPGGSLRGSSY